MSTDSLASEWTLLQEQCFGYERHSLAIKLVATSLVALSLLMPFDIQWPVCVIVGILWLQDAIWKTFHSRIETRIILVEEALADVPSTQSRPAFQLHTQFRAARRKGGALGQYLRQGVRPTVAYPYIVLIGLLVATRLVHGWM